MCEICHFPFVVEVFSEKGALRIVEDCIPIIDLYNILFDETRSMCTPAVFEHNDLKLGTPYDWLCPRKEPHETQSTCFITDHGNIPLKILEDSKTLILVAVSTSCDQLVVPVSSRASSVQADYDHKYAWDGKIDSSEPIQVEEEEEEEEEEEVAASTVCDFDTPLNHDAYNISAVTFRSLYEHFCDQVHLTEEYYDYVSSICEFDEAANSGFFESAEFTNLWSYVSKYCYLSDYYSESESNYYYYTNPDTEQKPFVSQPEVQPWLQLEFASEVEITQIYVTARHDCCEDSFSNIDITVGMESMDQAGAVSKNPLCSTYDGPPSLGQTITITCSRPLTGLYIVIQKKNDHDSPKELAVSEVKICGRALDDVNAS